MRLATDLSCHRRDVPLVPLLAPLAPGWTGGGPTAWDRRYDEWAAVAPEVHQLVDVEDADLVVIPTDWYWVRGPSWASRPDRGLAHRLRGLHERARDAGVPVAVFFTGDRSCDRVDLPGAHVFREGPFRSRLGPTDHPYPAFAEDLVAAHLGGEPVVRPRAQRAVVGFCGLAAPRRGPTAVARRLAFHLAVGVRERRLDPPPTVGEELRARALELLDASPLVDTNFVVRDSSVFFRDAETAELVDVRRQYVDNLVDCDYVLCIRGSGNYSYRLYEALCMGRTPIVVDTDLALPLADQLDWADLCVWVRPDEVERLPEVVAAVHEGRGDDEAIARQHRARAAWLEHLSPQGYLARIADVLG